MFERLLAFLKQLPSSTDAEASRADDPRVAAAALMFHVMDADGVRADGEFELLERVLSEIYGVGDNELAGIVKAGEEAEREAVDLYAFTSVLNRQLSQEKCVGLIGILWEIVYADGELHEVEDNILWRVAELLHVESRDRVELRRRAAGASGT